jgi:hypothetical protein
MHFLTARPSWKSAKQGYTGELVLQESVTNLGISFYGQLAERSGWNRVKHEVPREVLTYGGGDRLT